MLNELNKEKSLYLRQHQENPVAWQAYKPETLKLAQKENKPLFISIGYSSCHWCHVMAHESFEDPKTAEILNKNFIPVKVDREEFPSIDKKYQFYLHATGKRGGWPLSVFCLPDGRPFFGGTYYPPVARHNLPAFSDMLMQLGKLYRESPQEAAKYADNYDRFLEKFLAAEHTSQALSEISRGEMLEVFKKMFDMENGGIGTDAKFPNIPVLSAMLSFWEDEDVSAFLRLTADRLCTSGIYDHINGGFYRYTVDKRWQVPHFEKMLYDNALNASFLLEMFERTDNMLYMKTAEKTIDFILTEFSTEFGLIAATDADSLDETGKNAEGFYYLVTEEQAAPIKDHVELTEGVITVKEADYEKYVELEKVFETIKKSNSRQKPGRDEKVILSQNMMFCSALLKMSEMSGKDFYMEQATALYGKIKHFLSDGDTLFRINYQGDIFGNVTLEDYAATIRTSLDFFEITKEKVFLKEASAFTARAFEMFFADGKFYLDKDRSVVETFDDSTPNPLALMLNILENHGPELGMPPEQEFIDFCADRLIKYAGGHPTLFSAMKDRIG